MKNTILAALAAAAAVHLLTGWFNAFVILPMFAVPAYLIARTWRDGPRAMRFCAEETDDD